MALKRKLYYTLPLLTRKISACGYGSFSVFYHFNISVTIHFALLHLPEVISFQFPYTWPLDLVSGISIELHVELIFRIGICKWSGFLHLSKRNRLWTITSSLIILSMNSDAEGQCYRSLTKSFSKKVLWWFCI